MLRDTGALTLGDEPLAGRVEHQKSSLIQIVKSVQRLLSSGRWFDVEAFEMSHHWERELLKLGNQVNNHVDIIRPAHVKPYVKRGKSDAVDAAGTVGSCLISSWDRQRPSYPSARW